ncbi:hypothetical protein C0J45_8825 [Silurus meridionalis]|nr:hypothetical protein C0J45_8825 [Silurus meridionalis]
MKLMEPFGAAIADLPLRPLLFTAVIAASAGIFCYLFKRGDGKKPTADPQDKTPPEAVCDQATELSLPQPEEVPQYQRFVKKVVKKYQKAIKNIAEMEAQKSKLEEQVEILQDSVQQMCKCISVSQKEFDEYKQNFNKERQRAVETITQLEEAKDLVQTLRVTVQDIGNLLCDTQQECDKLTEECVRNQETHTILQLENNKLKEQLLQCEQLISEREQEVETHNLLKIKYKQMEETLGHKEELLQVSLMKVKENHQMAEETISLLLMESSDQVKSVQETVLELWDLLYEFDELNEVSISV